MSGEVRLMPMTLERCHELYAHWQNDPAIYADVSHFQPFRYDREWVERYYARQQAADRRYFAIMRHDAVIGEILLKRIDWQEKTCVLSIHLQNDHVKNRGYGTHAERLAVSYAFEQMGMRAIYADALIGNARSRHVLEKVGFEYYKEDGVFAYYRMEKEKSSRKGEG